MTPEHFEKNVPLATRAPPLPPRNIPRPVWIGGAICAGLVVLLMCAGVGIKWFASAYGPAGAKDDAAKNDKAVMSVQIKWLPLTEAERSRWERVRSKVRKNFEAVTRRGDGFAEFLGAGDITDAQRKASLERIKKEQEENLKKASDRRFQFFAYSMRAKFWTAPSMTTNDYMVTRPDFWGGLPKDTFPAARRSVYLMDDDKTAKSHADLIAALPDVRCVAQVDLYSKENPVIVRWVHDTGSGPRAGPTLPFAELEKELKVFVYNLQTTAE